MPHTLVSAYSSSLYSHPDPRETRPTPRTLSTLFAPDHRNNDHNSSPQIPFIIKWIVENLIIKPLMMIFWFIVWLLKNFPGFYIFFLLKFLIQLLLGLGNLMNISKWPEDIFIPANPIMGIAAADREWMRMVAK